MADFLRWLEAERDLRFDDFEALWRWSVDDVEDFWAALWAYLDILSDSPYDSVMSGTEMISTRWFVGARINYAEHALRHEARAAPDEIALRHSSEIRPLGPCHGLRWGMRFVTWRRRCGPSA